MDKKMTLLPKPDEDSAIFIKKEDDDNIPPFIKGSGDLNLLCGYCETLLCEGMVKGQTRNMIFKCPICNNYNSAL